MKRLFRQLRHEQSGFTLIELLIVIAILGIIAAIVVPNVAGFMTSGTLNAANTEAQNVKTAAVGYLAENGKWPTSSNDLGAFLEGGTINLRATYQFGGDSVIDAGTAPSGTKPWTGIHWDVASQTWVRGESGG
jgi:type IV pilus assembly protein PilA